MQTDNRLFDDLARMANGALHTISGVREELESRLRERVERWLADMDMVPREEFEAVRQLAQNARMEQEKLAARVEALERQLAAVPADRAAAEAPPKPARRPTARRRPAKPETAD
jgi:hypothetical protein